MFGKRNLVEEYKLEIGDTVRCITDSGGFGKMKAGETYPVEAITYGSETGQAGIKVGNGFVLYASHPLTLEKVGANPTVDPEVYNMPVVSFGELAVDAQNMLLSAFLLGKTIQRRSRFGQSDSGDGMWEDVRLPLWDAEDIFRVKPEPTEVELATDKVAALRAELF